MSLYKWGHGVDITVTNTLQGCGFSFVDHGKHLRVYVSDGSSDGVWIKYYPASGRWHTHNEKNKGRGAMSMISYCKRLTEDKQNRRVSFLKS